MPAGGRGGVRLLRVKEEKNLDYGGEMYAACCQWRCSRMVDLSHGAVVRCDTCFMPICGFCSSKVSRCAGCTWWLQKEPANSNHM